MARRVSGVGVPEASLERQTGGRAGRAVAHAEHGQWDQRGQQREERGVRREEASGASQVGQKRLETAPGARGRELTRTGHAAVLLVPEPLCQGTWKAELECGSETEGRRGDSTASGREQHFPSLR